MSYSKCISIVKGITKRLIKYYDESRVHNGIINYNKFIDKLDKDEEMSRYNISSLIKVLGGTVLTLPSAEEIERNVLNYA